MKLWVALFVSRLLAVCCEMFFMGYRLATYVSGEYAKGLFGIGSAVHSKLF